LEKLIIPSFLTIPYFIFDSKGKILENNEIFRDLFCKGKEEGSVFLLLRKIADSNYCKKDIINMKKSLSKFGRWDGVINPDNDIDSSLVVEIIKANQKKSTYLAILHPLFTSYQQNNRDSLILDSLRERKFIMFFQSIVSNSTQKPIKYEALLRLKDGSNFISPFYFLDKVKKSEAYNSLIKFTIEEVFFYISIYHIEITINLSLEDIQKNEKFIISILSKKPLVAYYLTIEVLEDEFSRGGTSDLEGIKKTLKKIKALGVKLAVDDFGSKHSNYGRFLEFEPDIIKLDGSLIENIVDNKYMLDIVSSLSDFAKKHNIFTIAEFVEDEEIFNMLKKIGIDASQGYYFAKPEPAEIAFKNISSLGTIKKRAV